MNILFIGDIVGRPGRNYLKKNLPALIAQNSIDFIIANGENTAGGVGITRSTYDELLEMGIDVVTLGNHTWAKKEIFDFIFDAERMIRPANYPEGTPGNGFIVLEKNGVRVAVLNLCGRVFMECVECPFQTADKTLAKIKGRADVVIVDFHAEATSEKQAMGWYLDGRASAVLGTHTHVQTSDERVLPQGTAYITDVGMTGPLDSILGVDKDIIIKKFLTSLPARFEVAEGEAVLGAVIVELDDKFRTVGIRRISNSI